MCPLWRGALRFLQGAGTETCKAPFLTQIDFSWSVHRNAKKNGVTKTGPTNQIT